MEVAGRVYSSCSKDVRYHETLAGTWRWPAMLLSAAAAAASPPAAAASGGLVPPTACLRVCIPVCVVAGKGVERADLHPARAQLRGHVAAEAADVGAGCSSSRAGGEGEWEAARGRAASRRVPLPGLQLHLPAAAASHSSGRAGIAAAAPPASAPTQSQPGSPRQPQPPPKRTHGDACQPGGDHPRDRPLQVGPGGVVVARPVRGIGARAWVRRPASAGIPGGKLRWETLSVFVIA